MSCANCLARLTICAACLTIPLYLCVAASNIMLLIRAIQDKSWSYGGLLMFLVFADAISPRKKTYGPCDFCSFFVGVAANLTVIFVLLYGNVHPAPNEEWMDTFIVVTRIAILVAGALFITLGVCLVCTTRSESSSTPVIPKDFKRGDEEQGNGGEQQLSLVTNQDVVVIPKEEPAVEKE